MQIPAHTSHCVRQSSAELLFVFVLPQQFFTINLNIYINMLQNSKTLNIYLEQANLISNNYAGKLFANSCLHNEYYVDGQYCIFQNICILVVLCILS